MTTIALPYPFLCVECLNVHLTVRHRLTAFRLFVRSLRLTPLSSFLPPRKKELEDIIFYCSIFYSACLICGTGLGGSDRYQNPASLLQKRWRGGVFEDKVTRSTNPPPETYAKGQGKARKAFENMQLQRTGKEKNNRRTAAEFNAKLEQ